MSKIILFLTFLGIAHLLPAQNHPLKWGVNVGLPFPIFSSPNPRIHLSVNPNWYLTRKTSLEGEISFSYMNYYQNNSGFWGHNKGQTFQWQALTGLRYYFVGELHQYRPYMTFLAGYSFIKDEEYRDSRLWISRFNNFQLAGTINLEIKKHFVLTIGLHRAQLLTVARVGYQF